MGFHRIVIGRRTLLPDGQCEAPNMHRGGIRCTNSAQHIYRGMQLCTDHWRRLVGITYGRSVDCLREEYKSLCSSRYFRWIDDRGDLDVYAPCIRCDACGVYFDNLISSDHVSLCGSCYRQMHHDNDLMVSTEQGTMDKMYWARS